MYAESMHHLAVLVIHKWYELRQVNVRSGPVLEARTTFHRSLGITETALPKLFWCTHQEGVEQVRFSILDLEQFVAGGTDNIPCEENSHSQGNPCKNPDKAQSPSDQRKKAIIEKTALRVDAAPPQRGPPVIRMEERLWIPISTSPRCDDTLKPISKRAQKILRHEPMFENGPGLAPQQTILEL